MLEMGRSRRFRGLLSKWLAVASSRSRPPSSAVFFLARVRDRDKQRAGAPPGTKPVGDLVAIHSRHADIKENDLGLERIDGFQGVRSISRHVHGMHRTRRHPGQALGRVHVGQGKGVGNRKSESGPFGASRNRFLTPLTPADPFDLHYLASLMVGTTLRWVSITNPDKMIRLEGMGGLHPDARHMATDAAPSRFDGT
jgi:hypothetical protein